MGRLFLRFPRQEDKVDVLDFKEEFLASGQNVAGFSGLDKMSFEEWIIKVTNDLSKITCGKNRVPATHFLVFRKKDERLKPYHIRCQVDSR
jgi:predicted acetyltransferase